MKKIFALLIFMLLAGPVAADVPISSDLTLAVMDIRRSPTTAPLIHRTNSPTDAPKVVRFVLYTGDLFMQNPQAHAYIMTDGYIDSSEPIRSLQGRGITIGRVPGCDGVAFENFGADIFMVGPCTNLEFKDNEFYTFTVYTDPALVSFHVSGPGVDVGAYHVFGGVYNSFDTVFGVAIDTNSSTYGLFNVRQVIGEE